MKALRSILLRDSKEKQEQKEIDAAKRVVDLVGGDQVKILTFAASKGTLKRGEHTTLCYGVNASAKVHIEPELPNVYPAFTKLRAPATVLPIFRT
jgi:hypothetical protein